MASPLASPIGSYQAQGEWDQLQTQFSQHMSLQPLPPAQSSASPPQQRSSPSQQNSDTPGKAANNTFVHKLHT
ncbi:hypothetical protein DM01DRAFT_302894 [Hesseltinella vesiculosa]|uniref:Uncharacterized protein n=1 Tax=Hesseltinella vesiculosa TaxID=101127 RepID=A0A1X2GVR4_9FUNG|nr:hypothetical protein DM01DRAFT_302894 [Hesseltinella vesiculosa]